MVARSENGAKGFEALGQPRAAFSRVTPQADRVLTPGSGARGQHVFQRHAVERWQGAVSLRRGLQSHRERRQVDECARPRRCAPSQIRRRRATTPRCGRAGSSSSPDCCTSSAGFATGATWPSTRSAASCWRSSSSTTMPVRRARSRRPMGARSRQGPTTPWTWQIAELFKVEKGLLHEIEAVLERVPYGMTSGWSTWEDGMSDKIQFVR